MSGRTNLKTSVLVTVFSLAIVSTTFAGRVIYVDADAIGANDGSSWADAYKYLQDALAAAYSGDEIWVAQGAYKPDPGGGITPGDREATFQLINGVTLKGGYAGFGQPDPNARNIDLYETILSGDLSGDDGPEFANNDENSYRVVTGSGTDPNTILDGFTITGGNADGPWPYHQGGGMYNAYGSPTLVNCTFRGNSAGGGGGMCNRSGNPMLVNCTFSGNNGNGMVNWTSSATLIGCTFRGNHRSGISCSDSSLTMSNCTISGNTANARGGGIECIESDLTMSNCLVSNNTSNDKGGGIYCDFNWLIGQTLTNCTISGNSALEGGGIYGNGSTTVSNCILWGNIAPTGPQIRGIGSVAYTDVQGGWGGLGNIDADPCFANSGYWEDPCNTPDTPWDDVWIDGNYHLFPGSPCIDAGDPNYIAEPNVTDMGGRPRVINGRIDMGAYEYSPPILAEARIVPQTINLASKGKWITCYIWLPEDYDVADINSSSVLLEDEIEPQWVWFDEEEQVAMVRFSREQAQAILNAGEVEVTITGQLTDGTTFEAKDVIIVINKGSRKSAK